MSNAELFYQVFGVHAPELRIWEPKDFIWWINQQAKDRVFSVGRCKDCKRLEQDGYCGVISRFVYDRDDFFCAKWERKDDGND